jgi:hypothetical protein
MSSVITNHARRSHRTQIVAEAVVSAYIREIAPTERAGERARSSERARAHRGRTESPQPIARSRLAPWTRGRAIAPRRPAAVEVGA